MIFYSSFLMDKDTRRILLFRRSKQRIWQTAHTSYRTPPKTPDENEVALGNLFQTVFRISEAEQPRVVVGSLFALTISTTQQLMTDFEYGEIMPWDVDEALRIDLDNRTRQAIKTNIGLLQFFSDVDRDVWCNIQEFAHAPTRS